MPSILGSLPSKICAPYASSPSPAPAWSGLSGQNGSLHPNPFSSPNCSTKPCRKSQANLASNDRIAPSPLRGKSRLRERLGEGRSISTAILNPYPRLLDPFLSVSPISKSQNCQTTRLLNYKTTQIPNYQTNGGCSSKLFLKSNLHQIPSPLGEG